MAEQATEKDKLELAKKEKLLHENGQLKRVAKNERVEKERLFEIEKLKIELELQTISQNEAIAQETDQPKMDVRRIVPRFNPKEDEIGLYLTIFERQLKFLNIPESKWIPYLISSLPTEIAQLIAREDEEDSQDYRKVKEMLLKRYRLTADRFRQLFSHHKKSPDTTWRDFYFETASYFDGWITEINIKDF
ncbi:hypothetical protein AVEN_20866-1 [Araneus ventricosus]|uniref:Uncharacterized protein n=1 Tax=Araneus ventricosus TaxID=182803 RepID=A0A4Y2DT40_ARAVE|nr:hypothetical protein AVEN_20866-1 [Araneus ventricosus]